jgi:hypothetical protein
VTVDVRSEIVVERALPVVAEYAADPANAPAWYANISSVDRVTPPPLTVGSRVAFVAHFLGRRLAYTDEVVELAAPAVVWSCARPKVPSPWRRPTPGLRKARAPHS